MHPTRRANLAVPERTRITPDQLTARLATPVKPVPEDPPLPIVRSRAMVLRSLLRDLLPVPRVLPGRRQRLYRIRQVTRTRNAEVTALLDVTEIPVLPLHVKHAMLAFGPLLVRLCVLRVIRAKKARDHQRPPAALHLAKEMNTLLPVLPPAPSVLRARKHKALPL